MPTISVVPRSGIPEPDGALRQLIAGAMDQLTPDRALIVDLHDSDDEAEVRAAIYLVADDRSLDVTVRKVRGEAHTLRVTQTHHEAPADAETLAALAQELEKMADELPEVAI